MILVDTSAWVDWFRNSDQRNARLRELVSSDQELATTDPIRFELLAGVRTRAQEQRVREALAACRNVPVRIEEWESAAGVYLTCRRSGFTPRSTLDCLIAAVAIRVDLPVLAHDKDFDRFAELTPLELASTARS